MKLHAIYRYYEGDGLQTRPPYFSKRLAAASFVAALGQADPADLGHVWLHVDGSEHSLPTSVTAGLRVDPLPSVGNAGSYLRAVWAATDPRLDPDDVVLLAEDDYLWAGDSVHDLIELFRRHPRVEAATPYDHPDYYTERLQRRYAARHAGAAVQVGPVLWRPVATTCMTYAARVRFFRDWLWLHAHVSRDVWPHDTGLWHTLTGSPVCWPGSVVGRARALSSTALLRATAVAALRRPRGRTPFRLYAAQAPLATHLQEPFLAPGLDWADLAARLDGATPTGSR
jgi:hypothetical protein